MNKKTKPLYPGQFYHIYNCGNNRENLFYRPENYIYFLKKYDYYLNGYLETYAFCLLPDHFHLLVRVKQLQDLPGFENPEGRPGADKPDLPGLRDLEGLLPGLISKQFSRLFNAYAKAINKQQCRSGSLFQKNFKRLPVDHPRYLPGLIYYIHANPQLHGLIDDFRNWPFSSYNKILEKRHSHLCKHAVISLFGDTEAYRYFHALDHDLKEIQRFRMEG